MKRSMKFLAGALAAVTMLSSAAMAAVSAKSTVYSDETVYLTSGTIVTKLPGVNTEFYDKYDTCVAENFVNCHKHNCWWWKNIYCYYKDFSGLTKVELGSSTKVDTDTSDSAQPKSTVPWAAVRKPATQTENTQSKFPGSSNSNSNKVYNSSCLLFGGKYYPSNMVDLTVFFQKYTHELTMLKGQIQLMNTGYKMHSSNTDVVRIYSDGTNQILEAIGTGSASVYLYTNGGVPFMRLDITVKDAIKPAIVPVIDVKAAQWNLSKIGDSTKISVYATDSVSKDIKLKVVFGQAAINGDTVTALSNGPIILSAYSASNPNICGYAILYVGKYTAAIVDGYWKPTQNGICGTMWNPNLWCEEGYMVCGWIEVSGIYIPVIKECEKPGTILPSVGVVPSQIFSLRDLINMCHGNLELVLEIITIYKDNGFSYYYDTYAEILKNIIDSKSVLSYYYLAELY